MTSRENFEFINKFLMHLAPVISKHNGFIDKFIGDCIMALFHRENNNADDAIKAGINMLSELSQFNINRKNNNMAPIKIGIGVNTGELMLGIVGEGNRLEGTVISDTVNTASRVESISKNYGVEFLISESTLNFLKQPGKYQLRFIDSLKVKGKTKEINVYEVFDHDNKEIIHNKNSSKQIYQQAWQDLRNKNIDQALIGFSKCLEICPTDTAAQYFITQIADRAPNDS